MYFIVFKIKIVKKILLRWVEFLREIGWKMQQKGIILKRKGIIPKWEQKKKKDKIQIAYGNY